MYTVEARTQHGSEWEYERLAWHIVDQCHTLKQAEVLRDDYRSRGIAARITTEGRVVVG